MKILIDRKKLVIVAEDIIEFGNFEGEEKWKVGSHLYLLDDGYIVHDVVEYPLDIVPNKYFYIDGQFTINPNWSDKPHGFAELSEHIENLMLSKAESELEIDERLTKLELGLV